ncbi:MAG TPA: aquaporin [Natronosporangium sp.]
MNNAEISRLGSEALGTLFFVFLGASVVMNSGLTLPAAFGWAFALAVVVWVFGAAGAHFNPWVTVALALRNVINWVTAAGYIIAQLLGGLVGALLAWWLFSSALGDEAAAGAVTHTDATGAELIGALAAEALLTLLLVLVVLHLIDGGRWIYGLGYGLAYGLGVLAISQLTGASMNFARTFGAELSATIADAGADWGNIWVYLVGPAIGVLLAWLLYPVLGGERAAARPVATAGKRES